MNTREEVKEITAILVAEYDCTLTSFDYCGLLRRYALAVGGFVKFNVVKSSFSYDQMINIYMWIRCGKSARVFFHRFILVSENALSVIRNACIVTADEQFVGNMPFAGGIITGLASGFSGATGADEWEGDYLLPGMIELHTDNLQRHLMPMRRVCYGPTSSVCDWSTTFLWCWKPGKSGEKLRDSPRFPHFAAAHR